jgi:hypothetical protein
VSKRRKKKEIEGEKKKKRNNEFFTDTSSRNRNIRRRYLWMSLIIYNDEQGGDEFEVKRYKRLTQDTTSNPGSPAPSNSAMEPAVTEINKNKIKKLKPKKRK